MYKQRLVYYLYSIFLKRISYFLFSLPFSAIPRLFRPPWNYIRANIRPLYPESIHAMRCFITTLKALLVCDFFFSTFIWRLTTLVLVLGWRYLARIHAQRGLPPWQLENNILHVWLCHSREVKASVQICSGQWLWWLLQQDDGKLFIGYKMITISHIAYRNMQNSPLIHKSSGRDHTSLPL